MKRSVACLFLLICLAWPATADADPGEAVDAYWRGDYTEALREFRVLAEKAHTVAQTYLAVMHELGQGTLINPTVSRQWRQLAARFRPGDYQRLMDHIAIQARAARARRPGVGANRSSEARLNRLRAQANAAGPTGAVDRGHAYYLGLGVPQDYVEAARWYFTAARRGDPAGQGYLGIMHVWGHGVIEDAVDAYMWLTLAIKGLPPGGQQARFRAVRNQLSRLLSNEGRKEGERKVREFRPLAE